VAARERSLDAQTVLACARTAAQRIQTPWQAAAAAHRDERALVLDGLLAYPGGTRHVFCLE
jgi:hypothetical protein